LRIGVSARLAKTAVAAIGDKDADAVELVWPTLTPPYADLFAWVEGRAERPASEDPAPFRPPMLSNAIADTDFAALDPAAFAAEWKWDGIRATGAAAGRRGRRIRHSRALFRAPADISAELISPKRSTSTVRSDGELPSCARAACNPSTRNAAAAQTARPSRPAAGGPAHLRAY
jgi:DNA ligase-1